MGLWSSFAGKVEVKITSASVPDTISRITDHGIALDSIQILSGLTFSCVIRRRDLRTLKYLCDKCSEELEVTRSLGIYWSLIRLKKRPIAVVGILALIVFALYFPTRVFFVEIEGNQSIPDHCIVEAAQQCGITFGASRREIRSEKMKNALLDRIPELQWAGINTYGCVAVITVQEREPVEYDENKVAVSSIVAERDGIVRTITVEQGTPLCKTGQAVKAGQVLVSGYTDCGLSIRAERAIAEVFAQTRRTVTVISPTIMQSKMPAPSVREQFFLQIGKKLINLSQDSGIPDASCDKIYTTYDLTLPGGFQLPVSLVRVVSSKRVLDTSEYFTNDCNSRLKNDAAQYLQSQMVAGEIIHSDVEISEETEISVLKGTFTCAEMIGREQDEEFYRENE